MNNSMNSSYACPDHPPNYTTVLDRYGGEQGLFAEFTIAETLTQVSFPIWLIVGFPGSILSLIIWTRKPMRQSSSIYLATLAAFDILLFVHQFIFYLATAWMLPVLDLPIWCEYYAVGSLFIQYMSPLLTLGFTVERYISICFPFKRGVLCTNNRAIKVTIGLMLISLSLASMQGYFFQYRNNVCNSREEITDSTKWQWHLIFYWSITTEVLIFCLVPISILIVNIFVIRETRRVASRDPLGGAGSGGNIAATTVMLLSVSFYLICACLPVALCQVLVHVFKHGPDCLRDDEIATNPTWRRVFQFHNIQTLLFSIALSHYAARFYIYVFTGKLFRQQLVLLFQPLCPSCLKKSSPPSFIESKIPRQTSFQTTRRTKPSDVINSAQHEKILLQCNNDTR